MLLIFQLQIHYDNNLYVKIQVITYHFRQAWCIYRFSSFASFKKKKKKMVKLAYVIKRTVLINALIHFK